MSSEANKAVASRYLNRATRMEVVDLDRFRIVDTPGIPDTSDLEVIRQHDEQDNVAEFFTDIAVDVEEMIAEQNTVVVLWHMSGTTIAPYLHPTTGVTIPAGETITRRGITILRLENAKVIEERTHEDRLGVLEQLGWQPALR